MFVAASTIATAVLVVQLLVICWIDARQAIIPNYMNLMLAASGLIVSWSVLGIPIYIAVFQSIIATAFFLALSYVYTKLRKKIGMGGGDIKFLGAAAIWVGLIGLPWVILIASFSGLLFLLARSLVERTFEKDQKLPFGPHLALGLLLTWLMRHDLQVLLS